MIKIGFKGKTIWINNKAHEFEYEILQAFSKSESVYVLLDPDSNIKNYGQFPNLVCLDSKCEQKWIADLPTTNTGDCYVGLLSLFPLRCASWSCYDCEISELSGKIKNKIFTK